MYCNEEVWLSRVLLTFDKLQTFAPTPKVQRGGLAVIAEHPVGKSPLDS